MSLCSACLLGNPAAQARHSAFSLPCHISRRFSARGRSLLHHTGTRRPTPGEVRACSPPLRRAGSYLDVQPGCVPLRVSEGGSRAAGAARLPEQPQGVQQAARRSKPVPRLPGGCVGKHELSSHPHPDVAELDEPQPLLGYVSRSPPADLLSHCTFGCSPVPYRASRSCSVLPQSIRSGQQHQSAWSCPKVPCRPEAWVEMRALRHGACLLGLCLGRI